MITKKKEKETGERKFNINGNISSLSYKEKQFLL